MTSQIPIKIKGKIVYAKVGGYTGSTETADPIEDILTGYIIWLPKDQIRGLNLKAGSKIRISIGGKKIVGEVKNWSRGSKIIYLPYKLGHYISKQTAIKLHEQACREGYCV